MREEREGKKEKERGREKKGEREREGKKKGKREGEKGQCRSCSLDFGRRSSVGV